MLLVAKVREKEVTVWTKDSERLVQEAFHGTIAMGGLDIHNDIKSALGKRQSLCIPLKKGKSLHGIMPVTEGNGFCGTIYADQGVWLERAHDVRGPSAASAPYLQDIKTLQIKSAGNMVIQLDAIPVPLIDLAQCQRFCISLQVSIAIVHKEQVCFFIRYCQVVVPQSHQCLIHARRDTTSESNDSR